MDEKKVPRIRFEVEDCDPGSEARAGSLSTRRGRVQTPVFMPVGTTGTVKAMDPEDLAELGFGLILGNTYHMMVRPGEEVIRLHGGLHSFMGWAGSILTDSGGYQVFSLAHRRRISEQGVSFCNHIDGDMCMLTPERSISIQETLGADIMMAFDECPPCGADRSYLRASMERTSRWAERCLRARSRFGGALFGIVQGGLEKDLRLEHLDELASLGFEGLAIGGLSVGEEKQDTEAMVAFLAPRMPADRPRYLMGVGLPEDILHGIACGVDMFDCVVPTRNARNGQLFTWRGPIQIRHAAHRHSLEPIDARCGCPVCRRFTRAYLRHLYRMDELLGMRLNTLHNLYFYAELLREARRAILRGDYAAWSAEVMRGLQG
ncbi:MAG: tRNA guanosine(34) transglycosylase Tgt [Deltaproteobacteria bacterium]|nr:tRNA guanosine(34) transglycosylase Tgt [Deltaproteobacteria bacterium]